MSFAFKNLQEVQLDKLDYQWENLKLCDKLKETIKNEFKFDKMTQVQAASIPAMLEGKDVIVQARTGSGKTLSFLIPIVEMLIQLDAKKPIESHQMLALILSPTRELSTQIHQVLRQMTKKLQLTNNKTLISHLLTGAHSVSKDLEKFDKFGGNIIVATPGRIQTIMEMKDNNLSLSIRKSLSFLVFDEADQLLSIGFEQALSSILGYLPKQRRTSLFSATQTDDLEALIKSGLRNPIKINVNAQQFSSGSCQAFDGQSMAVRGMVENEDCATSGLRKRLVMPDKLKNYYYRCDSYMEKLALIVELIKQNESPKTLIFLSTCSQIDYFHYCLQEALKKPVDTNGKNRRAKGQVEIPILKLHRRLKNKRKALFESFKRMKQCILLATDILSRGIDVPDISYVIHLDLPESAESYVHRSGRSGHQIGLKGKSLLLLEAHEMDYVEMCRRRQVVLSPLPHDSQLELTTSNRDSGSTTTETTTTITSNAPEPAGNGTNQAGRRISSRLLINKEQLKVMRDKMVNMLLKRASEDKSFELLAIQAFVSYIRFYSSKMCLRKLLFPKLPIKELAREFGLARLPKMPELKNNKPRKTMKSGRTNQKEAPELKDDDDDDFL